MKNTSKLIYAFMIPVIPALLMSACSDSRNAPPAENSPVSAAVSDGQNEAQPENNKAAAAQKDITVISITSESGSTKFATEPVAGHVSEQIALWTPNFKKPPEPYYEKCTVTVTDKNGNVTLDSAGAQVKVRGNWTTSYVKKPLRIKFDEKQEMPEMHEGKKFKNWVLLAEYKDISLLRDKTALSFSRALLEKDGLYASDSELAEVYINGEYFGVYLLAEYQQINPDRVNITENPKDYQGTDIGYFMEFDGYFYNEDPFYAFHPDYADNAALIPFDGNGGSGKTMQCLGGNKSDIGISIKSDINSPAQHDFIASYTENVYNILYSAAYENKAFVFNEDHTDIYETTDLTPHEAAEKAADLDSLADMYIISELTCDADIYWSSFFMDADFGENGDKRLHFEAPWDFDSSMGLKERCSDGTGFYAANIVPDVNMNYETMNPWLAVMMYDEEFQKLISKKWTEAYDSGVFEDSLEAVKNDAAEYAPAFERNYQKWDNIRNNFAIVGEFSERTKKCRSHADACDQLYEWFSKRIEFLNGYWHE